MLMGMDNATLGTLLRHLTDLCDGDVERRYTELGLDYRARYTPVVKVLHARGPSSIRAIAELAGVTHSAASQTVAQMAKQGLAELEAGQDGRERIVALTPAAKRLLPRLKRLWEATEHASRTLDDELGQSLPDLLRRAIAALERRPLSARLPDPQPGAATQARAPKKATR
jgi:DNA-binding MarR family transcriptional regulator